MFYSYDPEAGIHFHGTADEARNRALDALEAATFHAADSDWNWNENEHEISWGKVHQVVRMNKREPTQKERDEMVDDGSIVEPSLDDVEV